MITFTEKLIHLKYELLMAYFDRDIQFLSFILIECRNMIRHEIFISVCQGMHDSKVTRLVEVTSSNRHAFVR
jgi:hypothetical protein